MCQLHLTHQYQYNIIKLEVNECSIKINIGSVKTKHLLDPNISQIHDQLNIIDTLNFSKKYIYIVYTI